MKQNKAKKAPSYLLVYVSLRIIWKKIGEERSESRYIWDIECVYNLKNVIITPVHAEKKKRTRDYANTLLEPRIYTYVDNSR